MIQNKVENAKAFGQEIGTVQYSAIENVDEIELVIQEFGADLVIDAINYRLRMRAFQDKAAGLENTLLNPDKTS